MQKVLLQALDAILPLACSLCGRYDFFSSKLSLCKKCIKTKSEKEVLSTNQRCEVCKSVLSIDECKYCNSRNIFFSNLKYIRIKGDLEREIIRKIKFGNAPYLSNFFRLGLKRLIPNLKQRQYSCMVVIPSNKSTIRKRPISVCKPVTTFIQKQFQIKTINPFKKKSKELQSGKSFRDRFLHAQLAFEMKQSFRNSLTGNYLLVDDVFTTGATINEIAKLLLMNGAKEVDVLVLVKGKQ